MRTRILAAAGIALVAGCNPPPDRVDIEGTEGGRVEVLFNDPGTRAQNLRSMDRLRT